MWSDDEEHGDVSLPRSASDIRWERGAWALLIGGGLVLVFLLLICF